MPKLLIDYDTYREEQIAKFISSHVKVNALNIKVLSRDDQILLDELKFKLSDVWVYTDDEHFNSNRELVLHIGDRLLLKSDENQMPIECHASKNGNSVLFVRQGLR